MTSMTCGESALNAAACSRIAFDRFAESIAITLSTRSSISSRSS
jgi:hypothetical protein